MHKILAKYWHIHEHFLLFFPRTVCSAYSDKTRDVISFEHLGNTHMVYHHRVSILNTSFECLLWLAINNKTNIQSSKWATTLAKSMWINFGPMATRSVLIKSAYFNTSFAWVCSDWLIKSQLSRVPDFSWTFRNNWNLVYKILVVVKVLPMCLLSPKCAYLIPH